LKETLNYKPTVAWSIDPFGHSAGMASILSGIGFDAWAIERIPVDEEIEIRKCKNKKFNWIWEPENFGDA